MFRPWSIADAHPAALRPEWVGNKAARLAFLKKNSIPVPDFFMLPAYTCKKYLHAKDSAIFSQFTRRFSRSFASFTKQHAGPTAYAVRSSTGSEDSVRYSFAGQFKTFLNLVDQDKIVDAIYSVFRSGCSNRLEDYPGFRRTADPGIAIVVQRMIQPIVSGVLFTINPSRLDDTLLIEYVVTTSEHLTEGSVEPFRITVNRKTGERQALGPAGLMSEQSNQWMMDRLLPASERIETLYSSPQDIEWAIGPDQQLWILQTRPITASARQEQVKVDREGREFTDFFFAERFPTPLSQLGWSIIGKVVEKNAFRDPLWFLGFDELAKESHLTGLFSGFPSTRLLVFQKLYSIIPLRFISMDKKVALGLMLRRQVWWLGLIKALPYLFTRLICINLDWIPFFHLHKWHIFFSSCMRNLKVLDEEIAGNQSDQKLLELLDKTIDLSDIFLSLHRWSITFADLYYELLLKFIALSAADADPVVMTQRLLSGLENNQTVLANLYIGHMAAAGSDLAGEISANWDRYFAEFGHRSESLDIFHPTWAENRKSIISFVGHIRGSGADNNSYSLPFAQKERKVAEKECSIHITQSSPLGLHKLHAGLFKYFLTRAQNFTLLRENQRDLWHRILAKTRAIVLQLANSLVLKGLITEPQDIFFITKDELAIMISSVSAEKFKQTIADRKRLFTAWTSTTAKPGTDRNQGKKSLMMQGIAVSRGTVIGSAHLATSYEQALSAKKDSILVARSIDPAWTPVFHLVSGLVLEVGGVLSHASILAREFGIPTVTGVRQATRLIRQDDLIKVDGNLGTITIIEEKL